MSFGGGRGNGKDFSMSDFMNQNSEDSEAESSDNTQQNEQPHRSGGRPDFGNGEMPDFGNMPEMPDFGGEMPDFGGKMPSSDGWKMPQDFDPNNAPDGSDPNGNPEQSTDNAGEDSAAPKNEQNENAPERPDKGQGGRPQPGGSFPGMTGSETTDHTTEFILLGVSALVLLLGLGFALKFKR